MISPILTLTNHDGWGQLESAVLKVSENQNVLISGFVVCLFRLDEDIFPFLFQFKSTYDRFIFSNVNDKGKVANASQD